MRAHITLQVKTVMRIGQYLQWPFKHDSDWSNFTALQNLLYVKLLNKAEFTLCKIVI